MAKYNIAVASDHTGVNLKTKIIEKFTKQGLKILDLGTNGDERVDYPDYSKKLIEEIFEETCEYGILISSHGIGMAIAANRSSSVRAALCNNLEMSKNARSYYDSNVLVIGSKVTEDDISLKMVDIFLNTKFEGGRHKRRIDKIV